jgi:hypothetical protein
MKEETAVAALEIIEAHTKSMLTELRGLLAGGSDSPERSAEEVSRNGNGTTNWVEVKRLTGQTYRWPEGNGGLETYDPFIVYKSDGGLLLAVAPLTNDREREQIWVFKMRPDLKGKRQLHRSLRLMTLPRQGR